MSHIRLSEYRIFSSDPSKKLLLPSNADFFLGPNTPEARCFKCIRSPTSGSSIPTIVSAISFFFCKRDRFIKFHRSNRNTLRKFSSSGITAGAQYIFSTFGLLDTHSCNRMFPSATADDQYLHCSTSLCSVSVYYNSSFFYMHFFICNKINCFGQYFPFCLLHHALFSVEFPVYPPAQS